MRSIDECMADSVSSLDERFQHSLSSEWDLVKRNQAITARNRNMRKICEMLDMPFTELPLERPEQAA
jgi:hypothetical protein